MSYLFTSESVSEGHPDKMADQISDAVLDAILQKDPDARVACECLVKTGLALVAGEITTNTWVDIENLVRDVIVDIGYTSSEMGFDGKSCSVLNAIGKQSFDIAQGVDGHRSGIGAGDQGIMFGYACNETDTLMPAPITLAHRLTKRLAHLRKDQVLSWLRPDAKSQVTLHYEDNKPVAVDTVVISTQHDETISQEDLKQAVMEEVIKPVMPKAWLSADTKYFINPTGRFVVGGPQGDCGLTGRKIIVDTYGGAAHHGGGAFSGKDPSKVDRSAAYMARYIAKNLVAAGVADRLEIQLSYAIGVMEPTSIFINTYNTHRIPKADIIALIKEHFDMTPSGIIDHLKLLEPVYRQTASYGHFGRNDLNLSWEQCDKASMLADITQCSPLTSQIKD